MLKFFSNGTITESKLITGIQLQDNHDHLNRKSITVTQFKGATVVDPNLGNYVVLDFTVTDAAALDIDHIILMNDQTPVADSADKQLSIVKEAGKNLKIRLAAQFEGAEHCKFNTTSVNLPYATSFRDGVVRFANVTTSYGDGSWNITDKEDNKSGTVYSADVVDKKISQVTSSLGNLDQYAKKAEANEFTAANNTFANNITVNGEIGGTAVTDAGTGGDKHIVNVGYADGTYLKKTDAENAAVNYAKLNADNEFAANTTNTFNGDVTVKGTFVVGASQNEAAFAVTNKGIIGTEIQRDKVDNVQSVMLPTEGAVKKALNEVESALTQKDTDLQSQIDGINAGQNLADIVNNTTALAAYDVSHLKAKDDFQHGTSGAKWTIGDKVQVLGDVNVQSSVYELIKGKKPEGETNSIQSTSNDNYYWHYIGVYGTNAYTKSEIDAKVTEINTNIGKKADQTYVDTELGKKANSTDVYTKTDADDTFAVKVGDNTFTGNNTFNGYIIGSAVTSDIAGDIKVQGAKLTTSSGVSTFVNTVVADKITELNLDRSYLKLTSSEKQTVTSSVDFNGTIGGTAVAAVLNQTDDDGRKLVTVDYANEKLAQLASNNNFAGATNTFQAITATTVSAQTFTGDGVATQISIQGDRLPTESAVASFVGAKLAENRSATSNKDRVGAMGLFLYTGGDFQAMGALVAGTSLQAVGMQLPMDGVVSWSQGDAMAGMWRLLNNTIAGEPCLVLAIREE